MSRRPPPKVGGGDRTDRLSHILATGLGIGPPVANATARTGAQQEDEQRVANLMDIIDLHALTTPTGSIEERFKRQAATAADGLASRSLTAAQEQKILNSVFATTDDFAFAGITPTTETIGLTAAVAMNSMLVTLGYMPADDAVQFGKAANILLAAQARPDLFSKKVNDEGRVTDITDITDITTSTDSTSATPPTAPTSGALPQQRPGVRYNPIRFATALALYFTGVHRISNDTLTGKLLVATAAIGSIFVLVFGLWLAWANETFPGVGVAYYDSSENLIDRLNAALVYVRSNMRNRRDQASDYVHDIRNPGNFSGAVVPIYSEFVTLCSPNPTGFHGYGRALSSKRSNKSPNEWRAYCCTGLGE